MLCDAGPLNALIDPRQARHAECESVLGTILLPLLTTWPCYAEAMYLLHRLGGWRYEDALWELRNRTLLQIHVSTAAETQRMQELMRRYSDLPTDLADASLVAVAEASGCSEIFTFDKHFLAYRMADGGAFEVIPG